MSAAIAVLAAAAVLGWVRARSFLRAAEAGVFADPVGRVLEGRLSARRGRLRRR